MKLFIYTMALIAVGVVPLCAHAAQPSLGELLQIQQSTNTLCLVRGQGRARMLCRCAAVVVSNKLAIEGTADYQEQPEAVFEEAFEFCMGHEDKGFIASTAKLFQSKTAAEEFLRGNQPRQ